MDVMHFFSRRLVITGIVAAVLAGGGYAMFWPKALPLSQRYITEAVQDGALTEAVSANGTLNPVILVSVGTQVSGVVQKIRADFNDKVKKGQVLLELDPSLTTAALAQSEASAASAKASLDLARANMKRTRALFKKQYVTQQDVDTAEQALKAAEAQLALSTAQVQRDRINLGYTVIRSPVSGVVVSREVDVGQTVAASFQTPTLFKIAQSLTSMQIDSSFAEADIGGIRVGQEASFTVDAYPGREFEGKVRQVRLNPTTQQNVVTYNVVIDVNNDEGILLPGMTAYVSVITARLKKVLKVPNAALRFRPAAEAVIESGLPEAPTGTETGSEVGKKPQNKQPGLRGTVYLLGQKGLRPVRLRIGASDNTTTEVLSGPIKAGDRVVVDVATPGEAAKRQARVRIR